MWETKSVEVKCKCTCCDGSIQFSPDSVDYARRGMQVGARCSGCDCLVYLTVETAA